MKIKTSDGRLTIRHRMLGVFPLAFFLLHAYYYWTHGGLEHMLWMCNQGNLMLAIGMFAGTPKLIRMAVLWLIPGLPLWLWFIAMEGGWLLTSTFSHVGGLGVGLIALRTVGADRTTPIYAVIWYLVSQLICRVFTPAESNVNIAHRVYEGFEHMFSAYWQYWLATTAMVVAGAWLLGLVLQKTFPRPATGPS